MPDLATGRQTQKTKGRLDCERCWFDPATKNCLCKQPWLLSQKGRP